MMNKKILILDDDAYLLETLSILLMDSGYEIRALSNGKNIFDTIYEFHPDLVLMDIMLGDMDGRLICSRVKQQSDTKNLPVILMTGVAGLANSLYLPGAPDDFLPKPFELDFLLERIDNQLSN
nr:response regulator [Mucilaginibacter sp. X4EP1]MCS3813410.1 DNA-binding response OmpR family regulator [Mucilaginibacter sp. X4EP1]